MKTKVIAFYEPFIGRLADTINDYAARNKYTVISIAFSRNNGMWAALVTFEINEDPNA